ncbi:hypothetical protein RJ639_012284 [Escallonia herrerae]|uniref:Protein root UVB sensitive/RUS domain-containing protein n=1 Tax=Escallonia herrerae TaxID=1293975 RepID=A0AA88VM77_9ASTE|nr:hypothetical protein RJ639_012284 [Escallonia herrerae]
MQSTSYITPSNPHFHHPWPPHKTHFIKPLKSSLEPRPVSISSNTSLNYQFQEQELNKDECPLTPTRLPVVIRQSGGVSQYLWDGNNIKLVSIDGSPFSFSSFRFDEFGDGYRRLVRMCGSGVRNFFLPRETSGNYLEYVKWKLLHRVFSSALQVLATQAMFRAIGIGYSRSLPSAAALNWVLKDGLGRLSRCIYTASLASAFDTNLKRVRFTASVMFSMSIGVELLTPAFPQYFLLLASIANIAKQISLACYLATGSAVHRSFALADNIGEVSAKAHIQAVCFDNLGLMLVGALNIVLKNNQRLQAGLPFVVYPIFTVIDLFGIYQGLKHVHLQMLTKGRLEIIINTYIQFGFVPSPAEVSKEEGIDFLWSRGRELWPIRIGCLNFKSQMPKLSLMTMRCLNDDDFYFICMEIFCQGLARTEQIPHTCFSLMYHSKVFSFVCGKGQVLQMHVTSAEVSCFGGANGRIYPRLMAAQIQIEDSKRAARGDLDLLTGKMLELGWACKNVLLSTQEQARYNFVDD